MRTLLVAVDDGALPVLHPWVNAVGLRLGVPSLHVALQGTCATVGPLVLPGEGPCYLCWRMRALACEEDFTAAMALEEGLDARRLPSTAFRKVLPALLPMVTGAVVAELFALTLAIAPPRFAGGALTLDARGRGEKLHPVLSRPDCPACAKKDRRAREDALPDRTETTAATTDFDGVVRRAVDPLCGVLRTVEVMPKDLDEPERPFVVRAELANTHFRTGDDVFLSCSGKGWTRQQARDSALGEALERYAAMTWQPVRRISATYDELDGPGLHPRDLVLFADYQYDTTPYQPWRPETELEWVPAQSLVTRGRGVDSLAGNASGLPAASRGRAVPRDVERVRGRSRQGWRDAACVARGRRAGRLRDRVVAPTARPLCLRRGRARRTDPRDRRILRAARHRTRGAPPAVRHPPRPLPSRSCGPTRAPAAAIGVSASLDPVVAARSAVLEACAGAANVAHRASGGRRSGPGWRSWRLPPSKVADVGRPRPVVRRPGGGRDRDAVPPRGAAATVAGRRASPLPRATMVSRT